MGIMPIRMTPNESIPMVYVGMSCGKRAEATAKRTVCRRLALLGRKWIMPRCMRMTPPRKPRLRISSTSGQLLVSSCLKVDEEANGRSIAVVIRIEFALEIEVDAPAGADP